MALGREMSTPPTLQLSMAYFTFTNTSENLYHNREAIRLWWLHLIVDLMLLQKTQLKHGDTIYIVYQKTDTAHSELTVVCILHKDVVY